VYSLNSVHLGISSVIQRNSSARSSPANIFMGNSWDHQAILWVQCWQGWHFIPLKSINQWHNISIHRFCSLCASSVISVGLDAVCPFSQSLYG